MKNKPQFSSQIFYDEDTGTYYIGDPADASELRWTLPSVSGNLLPSIDEDNMVSDDDTKVPTQQSVKAYVDNSVTGFLPSIDEDNMVSDDDTKVPTQQSVKAYVDNSVTGFLPSIDEDNMVSDDDTKVPTQQSVKAYVDTAVAGAGAPTKEPYFPVLLGTEMSFVADGLQAIPAAICNAQNEYGLIPFYVPSDFSSLTSATLIIIPTATQAAADIDIYVTYGAHGENFYNHEESDTVSTYNLTSQKTTEIDISAIFSGIAAGDYGGVYVKQGTAGHNFDVVGLKLKYS